MPRPTDPSPRSPTAVPTGTTVGAILRRRPLVRTALFLVIVFSWPFYRLAQFALGSELYSYILLVPVVSAYLLWLGRQIPVSGGTQLSRGWALAFFLAGGVMLAVYFSQNPFAAPGPRQDSLAVAMYSFVFLLTGSCCWLLNLETIRIMAFPLGFLVFLAPLPISVESGLETLLQHGSSVVAHALFELIGTPVFREGTVFQLPGFNMQVAPECSGIHSTVALFITSLVAGQLLLRSTVSRTILALAVVPIALIRNGFRVTVIGELCVRIGPQMIDSYIHRHGGPIFFVLSLVPFGLLLFFLLRIERGKGRSIVSTP